MKKFFLHTATFFSFAILFSLIYAQSPLYTSNQNQYFLHGYAQAGVGHLSDDWLANTLDPTPLFSLFVQWVYQLTKWEPVFYLIYAVLMGIYAYSLIGIIELTIPITSSQTRWKNTRFLVFLALFLMIHSAALRFALSRGLGDNWSFLFEDGVADQRMLGLVLQPSSFGVFLLLSIYLFLKGHPYWAMLSHVFAASMHPTYLLSAGVLTITYSLLLIGEIWKANRASIHSGQVGETISNRPAHWPRKIIKTIPTLFPAVVALVSILPILIYVYSNFGNTPPQSTAQAQEILVHYRIPHHALVNWWFDATAIIKILIILCAIILVRKKRMLWILALPFSLAFLLTLTQVITNSNFLALLFPWRMSVFLLPISTTILIAWLVNKVGLYLENITYQRRPNLAPKYAPQHQSLNPPQSAGLIETILRAGSICLVALLVLIGIIRMTLDFQQKANIPERPLFDYIAQHHNPGEVYLTPIKMQDFRLATQSAQFIDFKAIPYQDEDVLEWYRRVQLANAFYKKQDCMPLNQLTSEGISHVILPMDEFGKACPGFKLVYEDTVYGLYEIPPANNP